MSPRLTVKVILNKSINHLSTMGKILKGSLKKGSFKKGK